MTEKTKLDNIIGIVKTEEKTDSVELKKEYYNSKSINKRYNAMYSKYCGLVVADMSTNPRICSARRISDMEIVDELNCLSNENEQLKHLIKQVLETTPIEHTLAMDLKNSIRELYDGDVE